MISQGVSINLSPVLLSEYTESFASKTQRRRPEYPARWPLTSFPLWSYRPFPHRPTSDISASMPAAGRPCFIGPEDLIPGRSCPVLMV